MGQTAEVISNEQHQMNETSKWVRALSMEKKVKNIEQDQLKKARQQRLAYLFDDSEDGEDVDGKMDSLAAGVNLSKFLKKVDQHLDVEKALIVDWE